MGFHRFMAAVLAALFGLTPAIAMADVYINVGSPGMFPWNIAKRGCSPYGQGVKCDDTAAGEGAGITFQAHEPNGNCVGGNPRQLPCVTYTFCFIKVSRRGGTSQYDIDKVSTDYGEPSTATAGAMSVGPQYTPTRKNCTAHWTNSNTLTLSADLLPIKRPGVKGTITCAAAPGFQATSYNSVWLMVPPLPKGTVVMFYPPGYNGRITNGFLWYDESCVKLET